MNIIRVHSAGAYFYKDAWRAREVARFVLHILKKDNKTVDVFLLRQNMMRALNKQWRGKDEPTNVLSFAERDVPEQLPKHLYDKNYLGEIYISPNFVRKHRQSFDHMVVHGMLHLLGYGHSTKDDAEQMEKKEAMLLKKITAL